MAMTIPFVIVMSFTTISTDDSIRIGREYTPLGMEAEGAVQKLSALAI
jgi:hypothetical protein